MTGYRPSSFLINSPTRIDFRLVIVLKVQLMLFVRHFMFFPPGESTLISFGCLSYGGYYYLKGEALLPPLTPNTFYIQFHRLQKHENKKARNESNNGNPYAGANNYHLTKQHQAAVCLSAQHELRLLWLSLVIM